MLLTDPKYTDARQALEQAGYKPGKAWEGIEKAAAAAVAATEFRNLDAALTAAVVAGDVAESCRLAIAIGINGSKAAEAIAVAHDAALREHYPWSEGYSFAAKAYNQAAGALRDILAVADPDTPVERAMKADAAARDAWLAAPDAAAGVEAAYTLLRLVAKVTAPRFITSDPYCTFGLAVALDERALPADTADPRGVVAVWTADPHRAAFGRTGRFGALLKAGARLEAPSAAKAFRRLELPDLVHMKGGEVVDPLLDPGIHARLEPTYDLVQYDAGRPQRV